MANNEVIDDEEYLLFKMLSDTVLLPRMVKGSSYKSKMGEEKLGILDNNLQPVVKKD